MALGQCKVDLVYDELKQRFLAGEFRFGERLTVSELGVAMGTSRQPVIDAIKRLEDDGLVEVTPQVGTHVVVPSPRDVVDFFEVFANLESLVTRLAAERREPHALGELKLSVPLVLNALEGDAFDLRTYLAGNRQFHRSVHRVASSPEAVAATVRFWDRSDFLIASMDMTQIGTNLSRAVAEHAAIAQAIEAGDARDAEALARRHVLVFAEAVESRLRAAMAVSRDHDVVSNRVGAAGSSQTS